MGIAMLDIQQCFGVSQENHIDLFTIGSIVELTPKHGSE